MKGWNVFHRTKEPSGVVNSAGIKGCAKEDGTDSCERRLLKTYNDGNKRSHQVSCLEQAPGDDGRCIVSLESNKAFFFQVQAINIASVVKSNGKYGPRGGTGIKTTEATWPLAPPKPVIIQEATTGGAIGLRFTQPHDTGGQKNSRLHPSYERAHSPARNPPCRFERASCGLRMWPLLQRIRSHSILERLRALE